MNFQNFIKHELRFVWNSALKSNVSGPLVHLSFYLITDFILLEHMCLLIFHSSQGDKKKQRMTKNKKSQEKTRKSQAEIN